MDPAIVTMVTMQECAEQPKLKNVTFQPFSRSKFVVFLEMGICFGFIFCLKCF